MKLYNKLIFLFFAMIIIGCAKKVNLECGTSELMSMPSIESKVLSLRTIDIADTSIAFINGQVLGKNSIEKKVTIDTLIFTSIWFVNRETSDSILCVADTNGRFQQHLVPGNYNIDFGMLGYNRLKTENINFVAGERKQLNVMLGHGFKETYIVNCQNFNSKDE